VEFQNEPIFSSRRCGRLMLIKISESVQIWLYWGRKDYPGKATEDNTQCQRENQRDYRNQESGTYADFLTSSLKQLDVLISASFSVDMGKTNRPS
jgi:hypothetical protein